MTKPQSDRWISRTAERVKIDGHQFSVTVHWAMVGGQARCVGLDVRAFTSKNAAKVDLSDAKPVGEWAEITSPALRQVRVAELVESSRQTTAAMKAMLDALPPAQVQAISSKTGAKRKPGPESRWTDELLRDVIAPAYRTGGRKPSQAVLRALRAHLKDPLISADVARKAVQKARQAGYLPAATPRRKA